MRLDPFWRTSTFRLSLGLACAFALVAAALLTGVYLQAAAYMTARADALLQAQARAVM